MDYASTFAQAPLYAPNFGNVSAEQLQQHYQQHYTLPQATLPEQPRNPYAATAVAQHQIACDIKPRLTKEQHDILEAHYMEQTKPNTSTKKGFAESLNVSLDKVNVSLHEVMPDRFGELTFDRRTGSRTAGRSPSRTRRKRKARCRP